MTQARIDTFYSMFRTEDGMFLVKRTTQEVDPERKNFTLESTEVAQATSLGAADAAFRLLGRPNAGQDHFDTPRAYRRPFRYQEGQ